jgi:TM2 domain-containing membrane protein YozV
VTAISGALVADRPGTHLWKRAFVLCLFLGFFGAHRFYVGRKGTAALQLVTFGGLGLWSAYDLFCIWTDRFTDRDGQPLLRA